MIFAIACVALANALLGLFALDHARHLTGHEFDAVPMIWLIGAGLAFTGFSAIANAIGWFLLFSRLLICKERV